MKVWIVWKTYECDGCGDGPGIIGVFSTREAAEKARDVYEAESQHTATVDAHEVQS